MNLIIWPISVGRQLSIKKQSDLLKIFTFEGWVDVLYYMRLLQLVCHLIFKKLRIEDKLKHRAAE